MPKRVRGAGVPHMVHFGARTGLVHELQMSHLQTWLIRRDMLGGSPWGYAWRRCLVTLWYVVAACRSNYAALINCILAARAAWDSAHRFAAVLPLGAPSPGPDPSLEAVPAVTRVGDPPYDSWTKRTQLAQ